VKRQDINGAVREDRTNRWGAVTAPRGHPLMKSPGLRWNPARGEATARLANQ